MRGRNTDRKTRLALEAAYAITGTRAAAARRVGLPRETARDLLALADHDESLAAFRRTARAQIETLALGVARRGFERAYETVGRSTAAQAATVASIATDKALLLAGEPTGRIEVRGIGERIREVYGIALAVAGPPRVAALAGADGTNGSALAVAAGVVSVESAAEDRGEGEADRLLVGDGSRRGDARGGREESAHREPHGAAVAAADGDGVPASRRARRRRRTRRP